MTETRYDIVVRQGDVIEIIRDVGWPTRNAWVDFGFRHGFDVRVREHVSRTRGEGTYR